MKDNLSAAEALTEYGVKALTTGRLLETLGIPTEAAQELLKKADYTLAALARLTVREISEVKGIGKAKAAALVAALEIGRRRQEEPATLKEQIMSSRDIYEIVHPRMRDLGQEEFWIALLDRRSKVLKIESIHTGGMAAMVVDPKIIFQKALQYKASSVVLIHNHPSGASSPSNEDIRLTDKIKAAGLLLDIKVLDHVIVGDNNYYSFADEGKM